MKLVVLANSHAVPTLGAERSRLRSMVDIGGRPVLWHILSQFAAHVREAIVCSSEESDAIREVLNVRALEASHAELPLESPSARLQASTPKVERIRVVETGPRTPTGECMRGLRRLIDDERFYLAYGDRLSDVDIDSLTELHEKEGALVTLTAVVPHARYGSVTLLETSNRARTFGTEPRERRGWINAGLFVVEPLALDYVEAEDSVWEAAVGKLARAGKVAAYRHTGFWRAVDTLHDENCLRDLWVGGRAPWTTWNERRSEG